MCLLHSLSLKLGCGYLATNHMIRGQPHQSSEMPIIKRLQLLYLSQIFLRDEEKEHLTGSLELCLTVCHSGVRERDPYGTYSQILEGRGCGHQFFIAVTKTPEKIT
jgi:hypothetical protein